jgi:uncharacterized membrane protein YuzA (DUF378 family)
MLNLNVLGWIALVLVVVGGLNWALVGIFSFDLVAAIFGEMSALARVVYAVVGIAAVYLLILAASTCKGSAVQAEPK